MSDIKPKKVYDCQKKAVKKYQQSDAYKEYKKAYRLANKDKFSAYTRKFNAKKKLQKQNDLISISNDTNEKSDIIV